MKKFITLLVSLVALLAITLTGCSNSGGTVSFRSKFIGGGTAQETYEEKLTYNVNYVSDSTDYPELNMFSNSNGYIDKDGIKYEGTFVTTFRVGNVNSIPHGVLSDIVSNENIAKEKIQEIYFFKTEFNVQATYSFKDSQTPTVVNDSIVTEVYFLPAGLSFAPIYSSYISDTNAFDLSKPSHLTRVKYDFKITYDLDEYTIDKTIVTFNADDSEATKSSSVTKEYDYKSVIDNNQLLFAVRNFDTNVETTTALEVLAPAYETSKSLTFSPHTTSSQPIGFVTGVSAQETLPVKTFYMNVGTGNTRGISHYFNVQTEASASVNNNALLIKYAQPLFDYSSMGCMGGIEFSLANTEFTLP